jgi:TolA-binding protein
MKQSYYLTAMVLGLLITTAAVSTASFAATANNNGNITNEGSNKANFRGQGPEIQQAISQNDYSAWEKAMREKVRAMRDQADKIEQTITQDNFNKLISAHQLMAQGKTEEAKAIFEELGLKGIELRNKGFGQGFHAGQNSKVEQ